MKRYFCSWLCTTLLMLAAPHAFAHTTLYVSQTSTNPTPPYATWDTAAHTIQEAVDVASNDDTVLVAAGEYALTNQVTITKAIVLRSDGGPDQTTINANWNLATRCLWVSNSLAVVDGFTMLKGAERDGSGLAGGVVMVGGVLRNCIVRMPGGIGAGRLVYCSSGGLITDCSIGRNSAFVAKGGGVYLIESELRNSTISGMLYGPAYGGADDGAGVYAVSSTISGCTITGNYARRAGGGAYLDGCVMDRCIITGNRGGVYLMTAGLGGGIFATNSVIRSSLIASNVADAGYDPETGDGGLPGFGGGIFLSGGGLLNSTVTGNRTVPPSGIEPSKGGGIYVEGGSVWNSIIYFNSAPSDTNWSSPEGGGSFHYCCTTPNPGVVALRNTVEDPQFVDRTNGNYRLAATSPCIDMGVNEAWMSGATDLDGHPRIFNSTVDLGAWESTNASSTSGSEPLVQFTSFQVNSGVIRSMIEGLPGQGTIIIERSADLIEWQPIHTNTITGDTFELVEQTDPGGPPQFFRALIRDYRTQGNQ